STHCTVAEAGPAQKDRLVHHVVFGCDGVFDRQALSDIEPRGVLPRTKSGLYGSYHDPDGACRRLHACHPDRSVPVFAWVQKRSLAHVPPLAGADLSGERCVWWTKRPVHGAAGVWRNNLPPWLYRISDPLAVQRLQGVSAYPQQGD